MLPEAAPLSFAPPAIATPVSHEPQAVTFHGSGAEYFRIWIVNLFLSIITLGIYSAWAKVRRLHYFYRNTRLAGAVFDYHGKPGAILKGRIVGAVLFAAYTGAGAISPLFGLGAAALIGLVLPWLLVRSLRFRLYNSSYRGLRFQFHGKTLSAYWVFVCLPILSVFTLFTLVPFVHHRIKRFQHDHAAFGRTRFRFGAPVSEFFVTYLLAISLLIGIVILAGFAAVLGMIVVMPRNPAGQPPGTPPEMAQQVLAILPFMLVYGSGILAMRALLMARLQNEIWSRMRLGAHRFSCRLDGVRLFGVLWTNVALTILTLGLFTPFAQIRLAQFTASAFTLLPGGALDEFAAGDQQQVAAYGQEMADFFDFDISF